MEEIVRYNYRLRPGKQAEMVLAAEWGRCRWLWNECVNQQKAGKKPTLKKLNALLTEARVKFSWLKEGSAVAQQQAIRKYSESYSQSFKIKGRGQPKVKKKNSSLPSLHYVGNAARIQDNKLCLPKMHSIPVVWSRELPSKPTSVTVFQDNLGHWYASFVVVREKEELEAVESEIGVDWGVITTATTTNESYNLPFQGFRKRSQAEVAKQQRKMARRHKKKGPQSKGYKEAKLSSAKAIKKAKRQAEHTARVWAKQVVDNHQLIAIEDFKPKFLSKSRMAKKAQDASIGTIKTVLIEKAERAGREVVLVNPAYTTMTCSNCFERANQQLNLSERTFICEFCDCKDDRDKNAAKVVLWFAKFTRAGHNPTSVEGVRRAVAFFREQNWLRPELGILVL